MKGINSNEKGFLPIAAFEGDHPEMYIGRYERDTRLDVLDSTEYAVNDETFD